MGSNLAPAGRWDGLPRMIVQIEVSVLEVVARFCGPDIRRRVPIDVFRQGTFQSAFACRALESWGERLFYEHAGSAARPIDCDGRVWLRHDERDSFVALADWPSPEGLLL